MKFARTLPAWIQLATVLGILFHPQFAFAYDHPLTDEAISEAYSIGQDVKSVNDFLSQYLRSLPVPPSGPQVAEIQLSTPYAQVVEVSAQHSVDYSSQQAEEDYRKRGDTISVRVKIVFTPDYSSYAEDFWRSVPVGLIQKDKHMAATSVDGQPIYAVDAEGGSWPIGANIYVTFSVVGVKSGPVQVEVMPPNGVPVHATFDLSSLR